MACACPSSTRIGELSHRSAKPAWRAMKGLHDVLGATRFAPWYLAKLWGAAVAAGVTAFALWRLAASLAPVSTGLVVFVPYVLLYGGLTLAFRIPAARALVAWRPRGG